ncbi:hypothetical protein SDC9_172440 [bioreactor metagenome]|uniref:Uncharacterized protein n=1 Tax=bioreactor metagenome TaxID=1076179 RepID=A0A645GMU8_9ZZZZ
MMNSPIALGIQIRIEIRRLFAKNLIGGKLVLPHKKICLVKPVLPQKGRLRIQGGQQGVFRHRYISGVKHPLQLIALI